MTPCGRVSKSAPVGVHRLPERRGRRLHAEREGNNEQWRVEDKYAPTLLPRAVRHHRPPNVLLKRAQLGLA